ncbi:MAG TPA: hypothetical protein PKW33_02960 [Anaerolineaceae bacterium]|nr:hypothetical protein [Anaerolineaceae bacterium]HPN50521.1 hypothetical protein [Anaerolineaceae bacterium]
MSLRRARTLLIALSLIAVMLLQAAASFKPVRAAEEPGKRTTTIQMAYTTYEWWLLTWAHSQVVCQIYAEHEGYPAPAEVLYFCGEDILNQWKATPTCTAAENGQSSEGCTGLYLHLAHVTPGEREITVNLAPPTVWLSLEGCTSGQQADQCENLPNLILTGEEPLPSESIIRIQGYVDDLPFSCAGATCTVALPVTGQGGARVDFWAESSFGDSSEHYTAQVRVVSWGNFSAPDGEASDRPLYYADVLSTQWRGEGQSTCAQSWEAFPEVGGPAPWLQTPDTVEGLKSSASYYLLAGNMIEQGLVNAADCPNKGLESAGVANACGVEKARPAVVEWQNSFDAEIIRVAQDTGVPAQLMKNVFSRESQFWPGMFTNYKEAGLGQLTENGADTVLLWNPDFFRQFCPLVFDGEVCQAGFGNLSEEEQAMLRGALVTKVNAACPDCPNGIDLSKANFSISVFARSLLANCEQTGHIIASASGKNAGDAATYADLWRFTLVNYNAGPGCLTEAVQETLREGLPLNWDTVATRLEPACQNAINYVNDISTVAGLPTPTPAAPIPTPVVIATEPTPQITLPVNETPTPGPTATPGPTPTGQAYPAPVNSPTPFPTATPVAYP